MSTPSEQPEWHHIFSPERARMVTLQDEKGTLYRVQAGLLAAESSVFKDMFAAATDTNDPIEAGFSSDWLPQFLQYSNAIYHDPDSGRYRRSNAFDLYFRQMGAPSLASLYLWCQKYDAEIQRYIPSRLVSLLRVYPVSILNIVGVSKVASDAESIDLARMVCDCVEKHVQTNQKLVEAITDALRPGWKEAFLLGVCRKLIVSDKPLGDDFTRRVMGIGQKDDSGKRSRTDDPNCHDSQEAASIAKKARME